MLRIVSILLGFVAFLTAWLLTRTLYLAPPPATWYALLPIVLVILTWMAVTRYSGWRWALAECTAAILAAWPLTFAIWPPGTDPADAGDEFLVPVSLNIPEALTRTSGDLPQTLKAVPGLKISVFADGLQTPRMLTFSPAGDLYVSLPRSGVIVVLPDRNRDGVADRQEIFARNLDLPHGLAFDGNALIVAENGSLTRLSDRDGNLQADHSEVLSADLPAGGGHWTRSVVIGSTGDFLVAAGSSCNVCLENDPRRAAIIRIPATGGSADIFASGLRNSVGLAFHPETGELWGSDNGRDRLGDDLPPEEINRIVQGADYGWPFCYGRRIPDPDLGSTTRCNRTEPPAVEMQAHSAPLGIAFGHRLDFPNSYRNMLYVAFHGSWNRTIPTGYKLVGIPFTDGRPSGPPQNIVSGWLKGRRAWGRPVCPAVGPDGALYLSDDRAGIIYRITMGDESSEGR
jgi:glucose/arabinose dehydrogenase